jgi:hypothetical protein
MVHGDHEEVKIAPRTNQLRTNHLPTLSSRAPTPKAFKSRLFSRDGMLCAALLGVCLLAAWPIAQIGINDDWSYILTTQAFVQTHHFIYNGWATAMLGWQVLWGALFAWLIRPDFIGIRLSMIPIALAIALLYHAILRNFGLNRAHALFGTLAFVLSPLFLALSATFMTDISGLFVIFLCLYLCQRALTAQQDSHAALWLAAAGLTNIALGSVRQIAWLGVLVIVPCCGWLLRRRRYIVPLTVILWIAGVISAKLLVAWFFRHPYSIQVALFPKSIHLRTLLQLLTSSWQVVTTSLLLTLPVLVTGVAARWPPDRRRVLRTVAAVLILGVVYLLCKHLGKPDLPDHIWSGNIITPYGIMQGPELFNSVHRVPPSQLLALFILMVLCTISFLRAISSSRSTRTAGTETLELSWRTVNVLLLPFLVCYLLLLFPVALVAVFDRYFLPIIAILFIVMLRWHQERVSLRIPAMAVATVAVIAVLGVAGTHDLFARARAEVRLTKALQQAGIPRTEIRGGFDFDTVTEVYTAGYLNDPHLVNPPGSFHPLLTDESGPCGDPFLIYLPAMHIKYVVTSGPRPCTVPTNFPAESYRTWLPPARRQLFVVVPSAVSRLGEP